MFRSEENKKRKIFACLGFLDTAFFSGVLLNLRDECLGCVWDGGEECGRLNDMKSLDKLCAITRNVEGGEREEKT